jgi:glycosyltransferase involved in cell wall biosynthesis
MPLVSVIIPTYNRAKYLVEAVNSVLAQTFSDYEIIVVDDGSTDNTREVLQPLMSDTRIHYVYQENRGESAARNHGIYLAAGKYIAFLDSDDLFTPTKLEKQTAYLNTHPEVAFVHSCFVRFDDQDADLGYRDTSRITGEVYPDLLLDWSVLIPPSCVMLRAEILKHVGGFDEELRWGPDLDMWRRITKAYPVGVVPKALTKMRTHAGNVSGDKVAAVASFRRYLDKAFEDDPNLDNLFKRRVLAKMYSNMGHNILGEGIPEEMRFVRQFSLTAIRYWPFQWSAYLGFFGSFLGPGLRNRLLKFWRKYRYQD